MRDFEWDEAKRIACLAKHNIDFEDAIKIFAGDHLIIEARSDVEPRLLAVGRFEGTEIAVVFTHRGLRRRIITARRARPDERRAYHAHVAGRGAPAPRQD